MNESQNWVPGDITPAHYPYMLALGILSKKWADCERALEFLMWDYLKAESRDDGELITTHIPNRTRIDILNSLANAKEERPEVKEAIAHAGKVFDAVRTNRNLLAHTQIGGVLDGALFAFRTTSTGKLRQETVTITLGRIQETVIQTNALHSYLIALHTHLRDLAPLPDKLPIPPILLNALREDYNLYMQQHPLPERQG